MQRGAAVWWSSSSVAADRQRWWLTAAAAAARAAVTTATAAAPATRAAAGCMSSVWTTSVLAQIVSLVPRHNDEFASQSKLMISITTVGTGFLDRSAQGSKCNMVVDATSIRSK